MSHPSEPSLPDQVIPLPAARVVPFERPQSELQKAVQERAQEMIDRENARTRSSRPAPWRRLLVMALATIPVFITFGAAIGFIGALRQFNTAIFESAAANPPASEPASQAGPLTTSDPDVVLLQPYSIPVEPRDEPRDDGKPTVTPDAR